MGPSSRTREQEHTQLDQLTLLYAMADHIQRARHVDLIYEESVEGLRRAVGADRSALLIADAAGVMRFKAWSGLSERYRRAVDGHSPWPPGTRDPRPVLIEDAALAEGLGELQEVVLTEGIRALAFIPLLHRGRLLGKFMLYRDQPHVFGESELRLAEVIAGHLAFALWRSRSDADQAHLLRRFEAERSVLESVVKQMPAGVMLADIPSGRIIMTNQQVPAAWRRPVRQAAEVADYAAWGGVDAAGEPLLAEDWPLARTVKRAETVRGEEIRIRRGDGTMGVIRMSSAPVLDVQGRPLAAVATLYDVTEEKEAEAHRAFLEDATRVLNESLELERTLNAVAQLVVGRHADWCVVYQVLETGVVRRVSSRHADRAKEALVRPFGDPVAKVGEDTLVAWAIRERKPLLAPEMTDGMVLDAHPDAPELREAVRRIRPRSVMILPLEVRGRALGAIALARAEGQYGEGDLSLMTDLAARAALAVENALLYEQARAADAAKANFLAVMSHEFRTPLSAILGYADILTAEVHGQLNPKQAGHLDRVKASVRHLSHLVDEILSYASMEAGREKVRLEGTDIGELARDVAGIMEPIAEASGLQFRLLAPDGAIQVRTDPSKVRQILINLVSNAIKYTPEGLVEIELRRDATGILCIVTDTGPGIAREHLENVFEPFWQVDRGDARRITGTGLGLAVARRLARLLGGDVRVRSRVGEGSVFTLELPLEVGPATPGS
ncbi:MAG TPA: ATP-binding protein [Longimicrobiales bacterium]|nr:ATP-binding protein [Longimicrobiales bacterium]